MSGEFQHIEHTDKNIRGLQKRTFFLPTAMTCEGKHFSYYFHIDYKETE